MNTSQLQKDHPEVYEEFFYENDTVISCPLITKLCGSYSEYFNGKSIKQKLPLRVYIGFKELGYNDNIILDRLYYIQGKNFKSTTIKSEWPKHSKFEISLNKYLIDDLFNKIIRPFRISLLIEGGLGNLNGLTSIGFSLIGTYLLKKRGELDFDFLNINSDKEIQENILKITKECKTLMRLYDKELTSNLWYPFVHIATSYLKGNLPFVFEKGEKGKIIFSKLEDSISHINGGGNIYRTIIISTSIGKWIGLIINHETNLNKAVQELLGGITDKINKNLNNFFQYNGSLKLFTELVEDLNKINYLYKACLNGEEKEFIIGSDRINNLLCELDLEYVTFGGENFGFGGMIGILINGTSNLESIEKKLESENYQIIYNSELDGMEFNGFNLEQDKSNNLVSKLYPSNKYIVRGNNLKKRNITIGKIAELQSKGEIFVNLFTNKIIIGGIHITSKQMSSQAFTIELIKAILNSEKGIIENKDLPQSSYSKNKNEFTGKILLPLKKCVKEILGKEINIKCSGSLVDYKVKATIKNLNIIFYEQC